MINIVISPSQQKWNPCCVAGCNEQQHTYDVGSRIYALLQGYACNVCLIPKITGDEAYTLNEVVRISNEFVKNHPADKSYHLDIHTDGGYDAHGASGFYYSDAGKAFLIQPWRRITKLTLTEDGTVSWRDLFVLRETDAIAGLLEICFHDKPEEAKWLHANFDLIAQEIVFGLAETTGILKKVIQPHWAEGSFQKLTQAGVKIEDRRFDEMMRRGEAFAILAQMLKG